MTKAWTTGVVHAPLQKSTAPPHILAFTDRESDQSTKYCCSQHHLGSLSARPPICGLSFAIEVLVYLSLDANGQGQTLLLQQQLLRALAAIAAQQSRTLPRQ